VLDPSNDHTVSWKSSLARTPIGPIRVTHDESSKCLG
jgi:hypothetical protein